MFVQALIKGSPYVGVYARASESLVLLPPSVDPALRSRIEGALGVRGVVMTAGGSEIVGSVVALNDHGAVVADFVEESEVELLREHDLSIGRLRGKLNAAGNVVLANNTGALVSADLSSRSREIVQRTLGVRVEKGTIAGLKTVGSLGVATSKGALLHPRVTPEEVEIVEKVLGVEADVGTVNHGVPYVGAGVLATSKGAVVGSSTTGIEIARIEEALHLY